LKRDIRDLQLKFERAGYRSLGSRSTWFTVYFPEGYYTAFPVLVMVFTRNIEPFLIDDIKVGLDLLVFGVVQRLNAKVVER